MRFWPTRPAAPVITTFMAPRLIAERDWHQIADRARALEWLEQLDGCRTALLCIARDSAADSRYGPRLNPSYTGAVFGRKASMSRPATLTWLIFLGAQG